VGDLIYEESLKSIPHLKSKKVEFPSLKETSCNSEVRHSTAHSVWNINDLKPGDHLCCLYETEKEYKEVIIPFIRAGLEQGEKVLSIVDTHTVEEILGYLKADCLEFIPYLESGQLHILNINKDYMHEDVYEPDGMTSLIRAETERAIAEGYTALRVNCEMTWALQEISYSEQLIEHETKLNDFSSSCKCLILCQYDRRLFDPRLLLDVLATHPIAIIGTEVYNNFYYESPTEFFSKDRYSRGLCNRLNNLALRKRAEELLLESNNRYKAMLENMSNAVAVFEAVDSGNDFIFKDFNRSAEIIEKMKRDDLIGISILNVFRGVQESGLFDVFRRVWRTGIPEHHPIYFYKNKKFVGWRESYIYKLPSGEIVLIYEDTTELKKAEGKYKTTLRTAFDGFYILDLQGRFLDMNDAYCRLTGYNREELLTMSLVDIEVKETPKEIKKHIKKVVEKGEDHFETCIKCKDGRIIDVEVNCNYVNIDEGKFFVFLRDITERKKVEKERKKLEEQLFHSQKMESIGRLAGGIAHDFNNILSAIMGWAELLKIEFTDSGSTAKKAADIIMKSAERGAELTKQLLGFARKENYSPETLNINNIIKDVIKVSEKIFEKNINVIYELDDNICNIEADKNQIEQVLTNIIINAKDAMPGGGNLIIKTKNVTSYREYTEKYPEIRPAQYVKILITDTGIGMPKEVKDRIFEPFFTTKEVGKGTGLGLVTVYGIIKNHRGYIYCDSICNEGTTFTVYLPVSEKYITKEKEEQTVKKGNEMILMIDDEEEILNMTKLQLENFGYKVLIANDGDTAVEIYKKKKNDIDLVLLDVIMPNKTAKDTYKDLKEINPDVKILLISGLGQYGKATEILNIGANDFIQKPFKMHELTKHIYKVLHE